MWPPRWVLGPRFLHSTGQLHKGGANTGVFVQFVVADQQDEAVPGQHYSFSVLKQAQALGDYQALLAHGRRAIRVDLGAEVEAGLSKALETVAGATRPPAAKKAAARKRARPTTKRAAGARKKAA